MPGSTRASSTIRRTVLAVALLTAAAGALHAQSPLARRLDRVLDTPPFHRHLWGVAVTDTAGRLLYGRNSDRLFMPASNTKLVVTSAAAVLLPPDGRVRTSLYGTGPVEDGVLQGDLVLYGRGDPTMSRRCYAADTAGIGATACMPDPFAPLRALAAEFARQGVREIAGDVVGDGSWFDAELVHPTWETSDLGWWYAAPVSGLAVNDNSIDVTIHPGVRIGAPARLDLEPELPEILIENRTRTVAAGSPSTFDLVRLPGAWTWLAIGDVPAEAAPRTQYIAVPDPNRYAALVLRYALADAGVAVRGGIRATTDSLAHAAARTSAPLAEWSSRPFRDWLFPILNTSQNLFAEMLLKQLSRHAGGPGSWEHAHQVTRRFLVDSAGLDSTMFRLRDGSGLSTGNLVTPYAFTRLLAWMRTHPRWEVFAAGLPRSGAAGSLRSRFTGTPLAGRVWAKTGTISGVNTLSGVVRRPDGRAYLFSIQANHHTLGSRAMIARIDSLVSAIGK